MFFPLYTKVVWLTPRKTAFSTPFFFFFLPLQCYDRHHIKAPNYLKGSEYKDLITWLLWLKATYWNLGSTSPYFSALFGYCQIFQLAVQCPPVSPLALHGYFSALPISSCSLAVLWVLCLITAPSGRFYCPCWLSNQMTQSCHVAGRRDTVPTVALVFFLLHWKK